MRVNDFYVYSTGGVAVAANGSASASINIQADAHFDWEKAVYFANINETTSLTYNTRVVPLATILITDAGNGRQLMDQALPITSLFGSAEIPFILPEPKRFTARSTITFNFTNLHDTDAYVIYLNLMGQKVFDLGGGKQSPNIAKLSRRMMR